MKKFMQSKISANQESQSNHMDFRPPLPLGPPPSDSPPPRPPEEDRYAVMELLTHIKEEAPDENPEPDDSQETETDDGGKKQEVCRDFLRGSCIRNKNCKYAHVFDTSQLRNLYKFCHDFQNAKCKMVKCKFAHATVFEEAEYLRTGILPANAFAHHKKPVLPTPPPPPPPPPEEPVPRDFSAPPPVSRPRLPPASPMQTGLSQPNGMETADVGKIRIASFAQPGPSSQSFSPDSKSNFPRSTECSDCTILENRLQHMQLKSEAMLSSIKSIDEKIAILNGCSTRMQAVMILLLNEQSENFAMYNDY